MIRHIVLTRFKADVTDAAREELMRAIADVAAALPGCGGFRAVANTSPETEMIKGFAHGFIVDFDDAAARRRYLDDPAHQAAGARLVAAAEGGQDGVLVFDYALDPSEARQ